MNFGDAITALRDGQKVDRTGWNGEGMYLELVVTKTTGQHQQIIGNKGKDSLQMRDFIMIKTAQNDHVPWTASQSDVLAEDWETAE